MQVLYGPWSLLDDVHYPRLPPKADWIHKKVHIVIFRNAVQGTYKGENMLSVVINIIIYTLLVIILVTVVYKKSDVLVLMC